MDVHFSDARTPSTSEFEPDHGLLAELVVQPGTSVSKSVDVNRNDQLPLGVNPGDEYVVFDSTEVGVVVRPGYMNLLEDGVLVGEGGWISGRKEGLWQYYHGNGRVSRTGEYRAGVVDGLWTLYSPEGEIEGRVSTRSGELHGDCFFGDSVTGISGLYENGTLVTKYETEDAALGGSE